MLTLLNYSIAMLKDLGLFEQDYQVSKSPIPLPHCLCLDLIVEELPGNDPGLNA